MVMNEDPHDILKCQNNERKKMGESMYPLKKKANVAIKRFKDNINVPILKIKRKSCTLFKHKSLANGYRLNQLHKSRMAFEKLKRIRHGKILIRTWSLLS